MATNANAQKGLVLHSVTVKNTFIEDGSFADDMVNGNSSAGDALNDAVSGKPIARQVSEPAPSTSKLLEQSMLSKPLSFMIGSFFEEEKIEEGNADGEDGDSDEPEQEDMQGRVPSKEDMQKEELAEPNESEEAELSEPRWTKEVTGDSADLNAACDNSSGFVHQDTEEAQVRDQFPQAAEPSVPHGGQGNRAMAGPSCALPARLPAISALGGADATAHMLTMPQISGAAAMTPLVYSQHGPMTAQDISGLLSAHDTSGLLSEWSNVYTVMMRNLPNKVTQQLLLSEMDAAGFVNGYDFVYLPIDPETNANRGYSFINFVTPGLALMFRMHFEGRKFNNFNSNKVVSVVPAALQGFDANYSHYSKTRVKHSDPSARPLFLREPRTKSRRGGKQKTDSLIDLASRQLQKQQQQLQEHKHTMSRVQAAHSYNAVPAPEPARATGQGRSAGYGNAQNQGDGNGPALRFCPYCGGRRQSDFKFCQYCGSPVSMNKAFI